MSLGHVLGHDRIKRILAKALAEGRFPPALLLAGPEGVGKRMLALAAAEALVCERGGGEACGACSTCTRIARAREALPALRKAADERPDEPERRNFLLRPDLVLIEPRRTATRQDIRIEQVRELVRQLEGRPFEARARVFVVSDAHAMTEQAQNALLKGLEEPPATSHVVLVTAAPQGLLPTIRSRCQVLRPGPLPAAVVEAYLRDRAGLGADEARLRASLAGGSLGAALAFESGAYRTLREELLTLLEGRDESGALGAAAGPRGPARGRRGSVGPERRRGRPSGRARPGSPGRAGDRAGRDRGRNAPRAAGIRPQAPRPGRAAGGAGRLNLAPLFRPVLEVMKQPTARRAQAISRPRVRGVATYGPNTPAGGRPV